MHKSKPFATFNPSKLITKNKTMKIKYDSKKVERISEEYVNVTLYLKGKVVYKATLPDENS